MNDTDYSANSESWLGAVDVGYLTEEERDAILAVLWRDEKIRKAETARVSKLKTELRDIKRKGAKNAENSYSTRVCARCNKPTGLIINSSAQCPICKHKVCQQCRFAGLFSRDWKCVVCYKEAQLKAETGEWFYGIMKPELRHMQDGPSVVKRAVSSKARHFDQRPQSEQVHPNRPVITCTPPPGRPNRHSKRDLHSTSSADTDGTGSSTESRKRKTHRGKFGPAETGSIKSLKNNHLKKSTSDTEYSSAQSSPSSSPQRNHRPLPLKRPEKPPRVHDADDGAISDDQQLNNNDYKIRNNAFQREIDTNPHLPVPAMRIKSTYDDTDYGRDRQVDADQLSVSSAESKSVDIDRAVAEYVSEQEKLKKREAKKLEKEHGIEGSYQSFQKHLYDDVSELSDGDSNFSEKEDQIAQLPQASPSTLPRRLNQKLLNQRKLSASVPNIYPPTSPMSQSRASTGGQRPMDDNTSMEFHSSMNKDLSTSVPDFMKSTTSLHSTSMHDLSITGEIRFALKFNYKTNILLVNIVDCRNLATADRRRKRSDPYVKCYLLPDRKNKQKTDVKKRTVSPTYNKCLKFSVNHSELSTRVLELSVWHAGTFTRNLFLGQVQLPLDTWDWESTNQNWFPLRQRETLSADFVRGTMYKGDLVVGLKYIPHHALPDSKHKPPHGELHVLVKQGKNLTPVRSNGTVDAYVKIMLQPDKQFKQKTAVISKNANPEWNTNFRMQLYQPMEESGCQLTIWHREKLQASTFLGGARLNLGRANEAPPKWMDAEGMEVSLWQTAISSPNKWIDGSMPLRPNM